MAVILKGEGRDVKRGGVCTDDRPHAMPATPDISIAQ
jgi:hypothetical protein